VNGRDEAMLDNLRDRQLASLQRYQAGLSSPQLANMKRRLREERRQLLKLALSDYDAHAERLSGLFDDLAGRLKQDGVLESLPSWTDWADDVQPAPPKPPIVTGFGEFWWWRTTPFGNLPEIHLDFADDGIRIHGGKSYFGDALIMRTFGCLAEFELHAPRFLTGGLRFASAPKIRLIGKASGSTGLYESVWHLDDKWSKCWLILRQTILQDGQVLESAQQITNLFHLENQPGYGYDDYPFFGQIDMPRVVFDQIPGSTASLWAQLEVRFDIQLEGQSAVWFDANKKIPGTSFDNALLLQDSQWRIYHVYDE
jgi:hypothetical protein